MKKMGLFLALPVCAGMVKAGEYAYPVFVNRQNDTTALAVADITCTLSGSTADGGFYNYSSGGGMGC